MPDALVQTIHPRMLALLEDARDLADESHAQNTLDTYLSLWTDFCAFCDHMQTPALPSHPATVVAYIRHLLPAQKISTVESKLAAIRHYHLKARAPDPTHDSAVKDTLDGARRRYGAPPDRKAAVEQDLLRRMLAVQTESLRGVRNRSVLLTGYACDLRRSEIVALQVRDIVFHPDRMIVKIRKSKTDQTREGFEINVPRILDDLDVCPAHALRTWLDVARIKDGPLYRKVDRWETVGESALTDQVVADIIKDAAAANGYDPKEFGGHSLRRGLITQAARNREQTGDIRKVSRHKTEIMVDAYRADTEETQMRVIGRALRKE